MKRVVSVSLGSPSRDKVADVEILGERVRIERIGCNADEHKARQFLEELDGKVDAFGIGGIDLGVRVFGRYYPIHGAQRLVRNVRHTPVVDGEGVRALVERRLMQKVEPQLETPPGPKRVLITTAVDRFDLALSFATAGYDILCGDLMFGLGLPVPIRGLRTLRILAPLTLPLAGRLPVSMLYPSGNKQETIVPKFQRHYQWASVIAGDFNYIKRHLPDRLAEKVVVTNSTTERDVELLRGRGVRYLVTSTPRLNGRSFGTNVMEAVLTAVAGKGRRLTYDELLELLQHVDLHPTVTRLS